MSAPRRFLSLGNAAKSHRGSRLNSCPGFIAIWALVLSASCSPKITTFEATPRHICPDDEVTLVWDFTGSGTITTTPAVTSAPNGSVSDTGRKTFKPKRPPPDASNPKGFSKILAHVTRGWRQPKDAEQDIEFDEGSEVSASIADPTATCENGIVSSTAHMSSFGGLTISVVGVADGNKRASFDIKRVVTHPNQTAADLKAHVTADQPSTALAGLPINGDWLISSPLLPGESCDPDSPVLPNSLIVRAYANCNSGGHP